MYLEYGILILLLFFQFLLLFAKEYMIILYIFIFQILIIILTYLLFYKAIYFLDEGIVVKKHLNKKIYYTNQIKACCFLHNDYKPIKKNLTFPDRYNPPDIYLLFFIETPKQEKIERICKSKSIDMWDRPLFYAKIEECPQAFLSGFRGTLYIKRAHFQKHEDKLLWAKNNITLICEGKDQP